MKKIFVVFALAIISLSFAPNAFAASTDYVFDASKGLICDYQGPGGAVVIPQTIDGVVVKGIASSAFRDNETITSITLVPSIITIGENAFSGCRNLTTANLSSQVTTLCAGTFEDCSALTSVNFPDSLTSIDEYCFEGCEKLASFSLPLSLENLGIASFANCGQILNVAIPQNVKSIGDDAFLGCTKLVAIEVSRENVSFASFDGALYDNAFSTLKYVPNGKAQLSLPASTHVIGEDACAGNEKLAMVMLPSSVQIIEPGAFAGCTNITSLALSENLTSIGTAAFYDCDNLDQVVLPEALKDIGAYAFSGCSSLSAIEIPQEVTTINDGLFLGCGSLVSVKLSQKTSALGGYSFAGCTHLTSLLLPAGLKDMGEGAFAGCVRLKKVVLPEGLTSLSAGVFEECNQIESLAFPSTLASVDKASFDSMASLASITVTETNSYFSSYDGALYSHDKTSLLYVPKTVSTIELAPNLAKVNAAAFADCVHLTSISLPSSVTSLGSESFSGCTKLENISIPVGVATIGGSAFQNCVGLKTIAIPSSVTSIGVGFLDGCTSLATIQVDANNTKFASVNGILYSKSLATLYVVPSAMTVANLSTNVRLIPYGAFDECRNLTSINLGANSGNYRSVYGTLVDVSQDMLICVPQKMVNLIIDCRYIEDCDDGAFYRCNSIASISFASPNYYFTYSDGFLRRSDGSVIYAFPSSVVGNGDDATVEIYAGYYENPEQIKTVKIGPDVAKIDIDAYADCAQLTQFIVDSNNTDFYSYDGALYDRASQTLLCVPQAKSALSFSPGVKGIGAYALRGCNKMTTISVPSSVAVISESAFDESNTLERIDVEANNSYFMSSDGVLYDKAMKTLIKTPHSKKVVVLPYGVSAVGVNAFAQSTTTSVLFPQSVQSIADNAFDDSAENLTLAFRGVPPKGYWYASLGVAAKIEFNPEATGWKQPVWHGVDSFANSALNKCLIRFDTQGGSQISAITGALGQYLSAPSIPLKSGAQFAGWYKDPQCSSSFNFGVDKANSDMTLYAKWTPVVTQPKSGDCYLYSFKKSTGIWKRAWNKARLSARLTIASSKKSVTLRPKVSSKARIYFKYSDKPYRNITNSSKVIHISRGKSRTIYFKVRAENAKSKTYKIIISRRR